ncbi:hypothetical protein ACFV3R_26250 [Streptomyces sp. NPDC059740]|uniref:hypothetical protein n=1 Tax=Streptomyces sp. NPDC059740 TaxID=3346926 RepID=UPI00365F5EAA
MFRRAFWFTTGAAAGVWATTKVHTKLRRLQPDSLAAQAADRALAAGARVRRFAVDVRTGMADREEQLHEALGLREAEPARRLPARPQPVPGTARLGSHQGPRGIERHENTGETTGRKRNEDH